MPTRSLAVLAAAMICSLSQPWTTPARSNLVTGSAQPSPPSTTSTARTQTPGRSTARSIGAPGEDSGAGSVVRVQYISDQLRSRIWTQETGAREVGDGFGTRHRPAVVKRVTGVGCARWIAVAVAVGLPLSARGSGQDESALGPQYQSADMPRGESAGGHRDESACGDLDESGSAAQETSQVEGQPVVADVRAVDRTIKPGGAPAVFCVTLDNPTDTSYDEARLFFTFYPGGDPSGPTLQWHSLSGWKELPLGWYDPDEPGELESDPLMVDLGPGETRTSTSGSGFPRGTAPTVPTTAVR
jgi:hypothetical protein